MPSSETDDLYVHLEAAGYSPGGMVFWSKEGAPTITEHVEDGRWTIASYEESDSPADVLEWIKDEYQQA